MLPGMRRLAFSARNPYIMNNSEKVSGNHTWSALIRIKYLSIRTKERGLIY
jgi:hypothetical protein